MKIIPAIFIQNGKVVSLYKGNVNAEKKVYPKQPASYVKFFAKEGAKTIFIVDLDGDQQEKLPELKDVFQGDIWWAGQVRDMGKIKWLFENGAACVVLGQSAKEIYADALKEYGEEKIIAGVQVNHYEGAPDLCEKLGGFGFEKIIMKDLNAEGTLFQPNFDLMEKCVYFSGSKIFASGGVGKERHLHLLAEAGVSGVIIARALYENQLDLGELIRNFARA